MEEEKNVSFAWQQWSLLLFPKKKKKTLASYFVVRALLSALLSLLLLLAVGCWLGIHNPCQGFLRRISKNGLIFILFLFFFRLFLLFPWVAIFLKSSLFSERSR